jgi:phospholipid N-methyltransferase
MKIFNFLSEYLKSPRTVGAVAPSSNKLAEKMVCDLDYENAKCIVEYGPGTGVFTDKLVNNIFLTFQYTLLKKKFIGGYFNKIELEKVLFNMPPAYVFKCKNSKVENI